MKIGHIASEISPIAKIGGLADVVYGLSKITAKEGHEVFVIIPAYHVVKKDFFKSSKPKAKTHDKIHYNLYKKKLGLVTIFGIDILKPHFDRDTIYGGADEVKFFLCFSHLAAHLALSLKPQIIHGHDWQSSFALFELKKAKSLIKSVLTLHNLQYQGLVDAEALIDLGLSFPLPPWMLDPANKQKANLLKIGIESADRITTVSKTYHDEILEGSNAFGMQQTLITHRHKFLGLLNGIDYSYFDPFKDKRLAPPFPKKALNHPETLKKAKLKNLEALLEENQKPYDDRFTVCSITRLADQKAPLLILYALEKVVNMGGRFILIGSLHGSPLDQEIINFLKKYENHPQVIVELNTNSLMAHRTYASSHALIIPSLFEPCGLTQMIALRYGVIPLARTTGGLKDTVFDVDTSELLEEKRNGFTFDFPDEGGIDWVIDRCFKLYKEKNSFFWSLACKNLQEDHSWEKAAVSYLELYEFLSMNAKVSD